MAPMRSVLAFFSALVLYGASVPALAGTPAELAAECKSTPPPSDTLPGAATFTYRAIGNRALRIHVFSPPGDGSRRPAALLFFGGGFRNGDAAVMISHARAFAAEGYVAAIADYRVLCRDGVTPAAGIDDAEAAHRWLRDHARELDVDTNRIVLVGGSAGGQLAAAAALREPRRIRPAALVLFNPVIDLTVGPWAEGMTPAQVSAYSASKLPITDLPPTIVFHGTADTTVPIRTSREFCARALAAKRTCDLVEYPGLVHSFYMRHDKIASLGVVPFDDTLAKTFAFLDGTLGRKPEH